MCAKITAFVISVASSLLWQAWKWTLTEELSRSSSWGARKLCAMFGKRRNPNHSVGDRWSHLHKTGVPMSFFLGNHSAKGEASNHVVFFFFNMIVSSSVL